MNYLYKNRQSNIELLRIICMFMILILHANYLSIGQPSSQNAVLSPCSTFLRIFIESLTVMSVNIFVLISGWFGINPKLKSITNFIFQCLFFSISIYSVMILLKKSSLNINGILDCFFCSNYYWFIRAYIGLYIVSPILNAFIKTASQKQFKNVLLLFYILSTLYGWTGIADEYQNGYSIISFMGLYLLARYIHLYPCNIKNYKQSINIIIILLLVTLNTFCSYFILLFNHNKDLSFRIINKNISYLSPIIIIGSIFVLLLFSKIKIQNKFINRVAISCFSIYLLHMNPNLFEMYFKNNIIYLYNNNNSIVFILYCFAFLLLIYSLATIIDNIRLFLWNIIAKKIFP